MAPPRSASALTFKEQQALTCLQNKGTGLANTCPAIEAGSSATKLPSTAHELTKFCLLPSPSLQQKALDRDSVPVTSRDRVGRSTPHLVW